MNVREIVADCDTCSSLQDSLLVNMNTDARAELRGLGLTIHCKKGQDVFQQGQNAEGCFCLRKGSVKTTLCTNDGKPLTVDIFSGKGVLGISGLLQPTNTVSATCLSDCELCFFPKRALSEAITKQSTLMHRVLQIQQQSYQQICNIALNLATKTVTERIAEALIRLSNTFGIDETGMIGFDISREEIALLTGTSVESVFRVLADFKKKQYIKVEAKGIKILNEKRLQRIAKMPVH